MGNRRALFLAPEAPYPLIGGGALRAGSLLEYLAQSYTVDAIVFQHDGQKVEFPAGRIHQMDTIKLPRHSKHYAARMLRNGRRLLRGSPPLPDRFSGFGGEMAGLLEGRASYDVAVVEHFWCAPYCEQIGPYCQRTILDLHNIESAWHLGCSKVMQWPQAAIHGRFYRAAMELERRWLPQYSLLLATSAQDAERVRQIAPGASVAVYPNTIPLVTRPNREERHAIAFSGSFEYEPNRMAVRYFIGQIWPILRQGWPGLRLLLVGRNPESIARYTAGDAGIECTGPVEDAVKQLSTVKVAVAPLLSGSGTRLKIVEAWAAGTPVVSTTIGAEGLPARDGENILLADGPVEFATAVSRLLDWPVGRERIGGAGRERYERELTWSAAWDALDRELEPVVKS